MLGLDPPLFVKVPQPGESKGIFVVFESSFAHLKVEASLLCTCLAQ